MSLPVETATSLYAPRPVRVTNPVAFLTSRQRSMLDKDTCNEFFLRHKTPMVISQFYQGWSPSTNHTGHPKHTPRLRERSNSSSDNSVDSNVSESTLSSYDSTGSQILERPKNPSPSHRHSPIEVDPAQLDSTSPRLDSVQIGNHINDLLNSDNVKDAVAELQHAIQTVDLCDLDANHDQDQVVATYSSMLRILCEPTMAKTINDISNVDVENDPNSIYNSIIWCVFAKIIEAGFRLETSAYVAMIEYLMDIKQQTLALQALYAMPRPCWNIQVYRIAVSLHMMQEPKQIQQAEYLMGEFGKSYIEVANPLAPIQLAPLRIETPLMNKVTEEDKAQLWVFYQSALSGTEWADERDRYERKMKDKKAEEDVRNRRNSIFQDWALRRTSDETEQERVRQDKIDMDNAMMYTALCNHQYEYGWRVYLQMKDDVDEFTPRVAVHLCWRAFGDTPMMTHVSRRAEWIERAWEVYGRFMCTEQLLPDQPETPGFLRDLLFITAFAPPEKEERSRYTRVMNIYKLLLKLNFDNLLCEEQIVGPMLAMFLLECKGSPTDMVNMCHEAVGIWQRKNLLDTQRGEHCTNPVLYWALMVLCNKSGTVNHFTRILENLLSCPNMEFPSSLLAPIQTFHDRHLGCSNCLFTDYLFKPIQLANNQVLSEKEEEEKLDAFGFVEHELSNSESLGPIGFVDHALYRRTNIQHPLAANLSMAAAIGAVQDKVPPILQVYFTPNKAKSLIRHCFEVGSKHK